MPERSSIPRPRRTVLLGRSIASAGFVLLWLATACSPSGSGNPVVDEWIGGDSGDPAGGSVVAGASDELDNGSPAEQGGGGSSSDGLAAPPDGSGGGGGEVPSAPPSDGPPPSDSPSGGDDTSALDPPEFSNFNFHAALEDARRNWARTDMGYTIAGEVVIPSGFHQITSPVDLRNLIGLHLRGASPNAVLWADFPNAESVILDMTGSFACRITSVRISGRAGIGLLLARSTNNASAGTHRFDGLKIDGRFARAAMVNICSEVNVWTACTFENHTASPAIKICNRSPWSDLNVGSSTMQNESYFGCNFNNYAPDASAMVFDIDNNAEAILSDITFAGGNVSLLNGANAAAMRIRIDAHCQQITIREMRWETGDARNSIYIQTPSDRLVNMNGLRILGGSMYQREAMVWAPYGQIVWCNFDGVFTNSTALADWGVGGIRPYVWVKHSFQSRVTLNALLPNPTPEAPWPATTFLWAWGG